MIDEVEEKLLDVPLLQNLALVDTPGTNAVIQRHSQVGVEVLGRGEETWGRPYRHGTGVVCDRSAAFAWSVSRFLSLEANPSFHVSLSLLPPSFPPPVDLPDRAPGRRRPLPHVHRPAFLRVGTDIPHVHRAVAQEGIGKGRGWICL